MRCATEEVSSGGEAVIYIGETSLAINAFGIFMSWGLVVQLLFYALILLLGLVGVRGLGLLDRRRADSPRQPGPRLLRVVQTELTGVEVESAFLAQEAIFGYERGRGELQGEVSRGRDQIAALREELRAQHNRVRVITEQRDQLRVDYQAALQAARPPPPPRPPPSGAGSTGGSSSAPADAECQDGESFFTSVLGQEFSLHVLKEMCKGDSLAVSGSKAELARRLAARSLLDIVGAQQRIGRPHQACSSRKTRRQPAHVSSNDAPCEKGEPN